MHLAPVVLVPHASGRQGWKDAMGAVADCLARRPSLTVTVRAAGAVLEHLAREERELWDSLDRHRVLWLAGGFSDPVLPALPAGAAALQLERETLAMDAAGVAPAGLWVGDAWEPALVDLAAERSLPLVFLDASLLDPPPRRPGPVERAGEAILAVPVLSSPPAGSPSDGLAAVRIDPFLLDDFVHVHPGRLSTPEHYLGAHLPGDRLRPQVTTPIPRPEREAFYRELLVLTRDQGDRRPGLETLLRLQSREYLVDGEGGEPELLEARRALDRSRHRGDSWVEVRDLDWDADGLAEVWVGTPDHTLVVDPATATVELWADRATGWVVTAVSPPLPGLLVRRLSEAGVEPSPPRLAVDGRTEGKSHAAVELSDPTVGSCRVEITGRTLSIELSLPPGQPLRVGPEIPVCLPGARLRADGGQWVEANEPLALSGHRFRLTDGERTLLVSSPRPCEMFVRPLEGGGIVIWPHWMMRQGGTRRVALTPS